MSPRQRSQPALDEAAQQRAEKWFSSCQRTIGGMGREQLMKLLTWMGVDRGVLSDNDTDHLLRLVLTHTDRKSESRLCDFMCNNKGQFRDQMTIIHRARAQRDSKIALSAFDPADTELVKNLSAELGFKDEWLVFEEQTTEDQNQQQIPEFMQRMQSFMGRFSGKRKASSSPKSEKKPHHKLGRTAPGQGLKELQAAWKNAGRLKEAQEQHAAAQT